MYLSINWNIESSIINTSDTHECNLLHQSIQKNILYYWCHVILLNVHCLNDKIKDFHLITRAFGTHTTKNEVLLQMQLGKSVLVMVKWCCSGLCDICKKVVTVEWLQTMERVQKGPILIRNPNEASLYVSDSNDSSEADDNWPTTLRKSSHHFFG